MTVQNSTSSASYNGNGVTVVFTVPFRFLSNDHLLVTRTDVATGVVTPLVLDSIGPNGYSVQGAGAPSGGTVTTVTAPTGAPVLQRIDIKRNVPITQLTDYIANDDFPAESHESALDKLTMICQQLLKNSMQLVLEDGQFVWDAQGNRIVRVGSGVNASDAANIGNVLTLIEQVLTGGTVVGVQPKYWEFTGDGEDSDFLLDGADVDNPLLYLVVIEGKTQEPYDQFTIIPGDTDGDRVLRLPAPLALNDEGFCILLGYARPWTGPQPITSTALTIRTFAGTAELLDSSAHDTLTVTSNAGEVTESLRENTGAPEDWKAGQFTSWRQGGTGQVVVALEDTGNLIVPTGFVAKTRGIGATITAVCEDPDTNTWSLSGDLERQSAVPELLAFTIEDRSALIGTNIATGTGKGHMIMPFGFVLESIASGGCYASLAVAQAAGTVLTVDVNRNGTSILATKLTFDNSEKTTKTATTPAVYDVNGSVLNAGDEITIDVDAVGTALAKGLTVYLVGRRAS